MVRGGKSSFEVKVAQDYVLCVGVGVLHTHAKVGYRSSAGFVRPESFLFWTYDFARLYIVRR
jgi:hypothetical protein